MNIVSPSFLFEEQEQVTDMRESDSRLLEALRFFSKSSATCFKNKQKSHIY